MFFYFLSLNHSNTVLKIVGLNEECVAVVQAVN